MAILRRRVQAFKLQVWGPLAAQQVPGEVITQKGHQYSDVTFGRKEKNSDKERKGARWPSA